MATEEVQALGAGDTGEAEDAPAAAAAARTSALARFESLRCGSGSLQRAGADVNKAATSERLALLFAKIDADNSGGIDKAEVGRHPMYRAQIQSGFRAVTHGRVILCRLCPLRW